MKKKNRTLILIILVAVVLFIVPYTRETDRYAADDIQWELFKNVNYFKEFNSESFSFEDQSNIPSELKALNNKQISIKGFLYSEIIGGDTLYLLSETRQHVCAFCSHDEHGHKILLFAEGFDMPSYIQDDDYVEAAGEFIISDSLKHLSPFGLYDIRSINKLQSDIQ